MTTKQSIERTERNWKPSVLALCWFFFDCLLQAIFKEPVLLSKVILALLVMYFFVWVVKLDVLVIKDLFSKEA